MSHPQEAKDIQIFVDRLAKAEAELKSARADVERLRKALVRYTSCRHASQDCNCTMEARAALWDPKENS